MLTNIKRTFVKPANYNLNQLQARITKFASNDPARLYTQDGSPISKVGIVNIGADGKIDVWVQEKALYNIELMVASSGYVVSTETGADPQVAPVAPVTDGVTQQDIDDTVDTFATTLGTMSTQNANNVVITNGQVQAAAMKAVSLIAKTGNDASPFLVSSSDVANALQLLVGFRSGLIAIQSIEQGVSYRALSINNDGGNVLIGSVTDDNLNKLQVTGSGKLTGPIKFAEFTLATLPAAATYSGYYITVTDATGGPKLYRSNGTTWIGGAGAVDGLASSTKTANYVAALVDSNTCVEMNVASANTFTVPNDSTVAFPVGTLLEVCQIGAGQTTVVAASGVTIRTSTSLAIRAQWGTASIRKRAANEWVLSGDMA